MHPDLSSAKDIQDIVFKDPFSEETRRTRRSLLLVGVLAILTKTYNIKLTSVPWLNIQVPSDAPHLLEGVLAVSVAYFLFIFSVYAWQDIRRWVLGAQVVSIKNFFSRFKEFSQHLYRVQDHLGKIAEEKKKQDPLFDIARKHTDEALEKIPKAVDTLGSMDTARRRLSTVQWFRLVVIEMATPFVVGGFALYKNWHSIPQLIQGILFG